VLGGLEAWPQLAMSRRAMVAVLAVLATESVTSRYFPQFNATERAGGHNSL
jgi:hypothetical protein